jgi:hypothetical protein
MWRIKIGDAVDIQENGLAAATPNARLRPTSRRFPGWEAEKEADLQATFMSTKVDQEVRSRLMWMIWIFTSDCAESATLILFR